MRFLLCSLGLAAGWGGAVLAQDYSKPIDLSTTTLHVYANLIQVPVLVLSPSLTPIPPVAPSRFSVSLNSGPPFRATHVRREGDDPISLSILVDVNGSDEELLRKLDDAIAELAPLSLRPQDHVSIYSLDCVLVQTMKDVPARQADLKRAMDSALQSWTYRKTKHAPRCKQSMRFWDALTFVTQDLQRAPGWRVVLALTDGSDSGGTHTSNDVKFVAQTLGVAIFGMAYAPFGPAPSRSYGYEDFFRSVCELSGGMLFETSKEGAAQTLLRFTKTLRERYIVEFPRPSNSTAGRHNIRIAIEKSDAFIRPAGVLVPIADPALLANPTTVQSDPSLAPVEGKSRVTTAPH